MLSAADYLFGCILLVGGVGAAALGADRVRGRLLPGWEGPPAWLATGLLAVALLLGVAELLGAFGAFQQIPYFATCAVAGLALRLGLGRTGSGGAATPPAPPLGRIATLIGLGVAALLFAHWSMATRGPLDHGMAGYDTVWYHEPFAAHFAQGGSTWALDFIAPRYQTWFYPANAELSHAIGILAFHRDLLSPLLNLVWLGGALLAAWCIGRPYGVAPGSMVAVALLFDSGVMADQAGSGRNDAIAICFLLGAAAVLINGRAAGRGAPFPAGVLAVGGLAVGLAAGVKLTLLAPAAVLMVGIPLIAPAGRRARSAALFGLPLLAGCGFWYLRNLVQAANPLPWVHSLGPISLPGPDQPLGGRPQHSVLDYLTDKSVIHSWFLPGLHHAFGALWPLILALAVAGMALQFHRRADPLLWVLAIAALVGAMAWLVQGASAEGNAHAPVGFESGLRHLAPALAIGFALLPVLPRLREERRRPIVLAGLVALLPFVDASGHPWRSDFLAGAVLIGIGVAAALIVLELVVARRPRARTVLLGAALAIAAIALAGRPLSQNYLRNRYAKGGFTPSGLNRAFVWAHGLSGVRIAVVANRTYPLYGTDLSNRVVYVGRHRPNAGFVDIRNCAEWRRALNRGHFDYVVISYDRTNEGPGPFPPQVAWTASDPAARQLIRLQPTAVFRLRGRLDPRGCGNRTGPPA